MILYHGSNVRIRRPDLAKSKPFKDFGRGFYLTADKEQAMRLAKQRESFLGGQACVNEYWFDEKLMKSSELKVRSWDNYCVEWGRFIMLNRDKDTAQPCHDFDIVYGPIADDGVALQLRRCRAGFITIDKMVEELKYGPGITFQYLFASEKALAKLVAL